MFFGGGLAYWAGDVPAVDATAEGAAFGISLTTTSDPDDLGGEPVLTGIL
jgi:hypothetical protein